MLASTYYACVPKPVSAKWSGVLNRFLVLETETPFSVADNAIWRGAFYRMVDGQYPRDERGREVYELFYPSDEAMKRHLPAEVYERAMKNVLPPPRDYSYQCPTVYIRPEGNINEGDIVETIRWGGNGRRAVCKAVIFRDCQFGEMGDGSMKVIGNIFQTPERFS